MNQIFNVDYCNHQLDISHDRKKMKVQIQAAQIFLSIKSILMTDHLEECIKSMKNVSPDTVHESDAFISELSSFLDSTEDSIVVKYAIHLKQLQKLLESYEPKFLDILNKIFIKGTLRTLTMSEMNEYVRLTKETIKSFFKTRDDVCSSAFKMFEVIVEQKRLTKIISTIQKLESLEKNFYG
jgi:hypothetical protein